MTGSPDGGRRNGHMRRCVRRFTSGTRKVAEVAGRSITVFESHALEPVGARGGANTGGDLTGLRLWEAAPVLIDYLQRHSERLIKGRRVLELGAGTGAVGISAAVLGAEHVVLTDADCSGSFASEIGWQECSILTRLAESAELNDVAARTSVAELEWGNAAHLHIHRQRHGKMFDLVIASDTLYYPPSTYGLLATTIEAMSTDGGAVVVAFKERHGGETAFFDELTASCGFESVASEAAGSMRLVELRAMARAC